MVKRRKPVGLARWIERTVHLPQGLAAEPGRVRLWPWQRAIADAISDPACERVTLLKPPRVGEAPRLRLAARAAWPWPPQGPPPMRCRSRSKAALACPVAALGRPPVRFTLPPLKRYPSCYPSKFCVEGLLAKYLF
jgi:Phage terminase large subunit (GpA)